MENRKLTHFEKNMIIKTFIFYVLSVLLALLMMIISYVQINTVQGLDAVVFYTFIKKNQLIFGLSFLTTGIGLIFTLHVVRRDRMMLMDKVGWEGQDYKFTEMKVLSDTYVTKIAEVVSFKEQCETLKHNLLLKENESKQVYLKYKSKLESNQSLQDELSILIEFYEKSSDKLNALIWITDYQGNILFKNSILTKKFGLSSDHITIYDVLNISMDQFELFRKRNFNHILLHLCDGSSVSGRNMRIFDGESMKYIIFMSETSNQEKVMNRSYLKKSRDLHFINEISKIISGQITVDTTLQDAIEKIAFLGNFDSCSLRLLNDQNMLELKALSGYSHDFVLDKQINTAHSHLGFAFNENKILMINQVSDMLFDDVAVKSILEANRKIAYIPLTNYSKTMGIMAILSDYDFDSESLILLESISINVTIALEKILLYEQLKTNYFKTVEAFVTASEIKSEKFSGHSRRVAQICKIIAELLYLDSSEVDKIYMAGLLHDVGKLAFSEQSSDYYEDYDNHGEIGRKMVEGVGLSEDILLGIEQHHLDFKSNQSTTTEQSYYAQIIRIANDFDLYMHEELTENHEPKFATDMKALTGIAYSPQFMKILDELLKTKNNALLSLYDGGVDHE